MNDGFVAPLTRCKERSDLSHKGRGEEHARTGIDCNSQVYVILQ